MYCRPCIEILFILPISVSEVAHRFLSILIILGDLCWDSSSNSRTNCKEHMRSGSNWSGNSKVKSPWEAKSIDPFHLESESEVLICETHLLTHPDLILLVDGSVCKRREREFPHW